MTSVSAAAALFVAAVLGCANLPDIAAGTCGNGVVEPHEDCDTFAPDATSVCLGKGTVGECHLDCRVRADGSRPSCPAGWGCDLQAVCRPPTGDFEPASHFKVGGAWSLMTGDFDGDLRRDVVSLEMPDHRGATKLRFHYFDDQGLLAETRVFPKSLASPAITDLSDDRRSDLAFSSDDFGVGVLLGQGDRSLVPETAGSYRFPDTSVRVLSVNDAPVQTANPVVGLASISGVPGIYGPDSSGSLIRRGTLLGPVEMLAGDPVSGDVIEDPQVSPCRELVFAFRDATSFSLTDPCTRNPTTGEITWRDQVAEWAVALEPSAPIDAAPQLVDMDHDGHLDVLLGGGGEVYVAYGDGRSLSTAVPYRLPVADVTRGSREISMPLATGDFTGDGEVDFVFGDHLLASELAPDGQLAGYVPIHFNQAAPWTVARIADLNDNGRPDVVAASDGRLGIDFFNGTGTLDLPAFSIPSTGPVLSLVVTDLDGDLVNDLAFVEAGASETERDSLRVSFGNLAGPPAAPATVARISHIDQIGDFHQGGTGNLTVVYTEESTAGRTGVLAFLAGSGDRLPFSPYELVDISQGSVFNAAALAVAAGKFTADSHGDVLALALMGSFPELSYQLWLLPGPGTSQSRPSRLAGELDPRLHPAYLDGLKVGVNVAAAAADLDGDGRDEALWAIPADSGTACGVEIIGAKPGGSPDMMPLGTIVLDQPCPGAQLLPADVDGDGAVDIALLTGSPGLPGRKLLVLWNDGAGAFASTNVSTVNVANDSPEQFTVLPRTPAHPLALVYVTDQAAVLISTVTSSRDFGPPRTLASLQHGSGIVAADVDGDGVLDLAIAASGDISILKARLGTP